MAGLRRWQQDRSVSLFERIEKQENSFSRRTRTAGLLASIKENLSRVLNTHPGSCQSEPALGISDLNDATATAADFHQAIEEEVRNCIMRYEPRIGRVTVSAASSDELNPLALSFHIEAQVNFEDIDDAIAFNIHLDNQQHFHLS